MRAQIDINPAKDIALVQLIDKPANTIVTAINLHDSSGRLLGSFDPQLLLVLDKYEVPILTLRDGVYYIGLEFNEGDNVGLKLIVKN